ncbi:MAG: ATP-grasp domain-containing protein [bacterium]|nr:ATP-grasp domain-containing protein [bacterium]
MPPVTKVLVANRGEIARRVLRTLRAMGIAGVAVYSDADAGAPHVAEADEAVRIGPAPARESYLVADRLLDAARRTGADAVHPGYGFLAENADFAQACADTGLTFIGPTPAAIRAMGSKIEAKRIMAKAGVPVVPGAEGDDAALVKAAATVGFPVLVKASAGGGGKGMRVVRAADALPAALAAARREAEHAFGDGTLLLERYVDSPRHVEVQIFGDAHGTAIHLFERECSIQRRHQKVLEEAPSPAVDAALRARLGEAAVTAARAIGYVGAGTVEFILAPDGAFYFLEVNTRLQVEHPVTECVTGLDLVRLQIEVARGEPLRVRPETLRIDGHAIEARLYAEDAAHDFLPASGRVTLWSAPDVPGVRWDVGVAVGSEVGVHYDPMLAKVIAHGADRAEAIARLEAALRRLGVAGLTTNRDFLLAVLRHSAFAAGALDTHFVERHLPPAARTAASDPTVVRTHAIVATLEGHARRRDAAASPVPPSVPSGWRNNRWRPQRVEWRVGGDEIAVQYVVGGDGTVGVEAGELRGRAAVVARDAGGLVVELDGLRRRYETAASGDVTVVHSLLGTTELRELPVFPAARAEEVAGGCVAPMTGVVRAVHVAAGERVTRGQVLLVLEAMKMEHEMAAHADGVVREVRVEVGQMVDPDAVLVIVEADPALEA